MPERYHIPNCLTSWKWPRRLNLHYHEVKAVSSAWARSFGAFSPRAQHAYDCCDFNLLASFAYPLADKARLRTGCDLMNMFFVFDEYSDVSHPDEVQVMADIIMDALRNPHIPRPVGEWIGGEMTRQFWELAIKTASAGGQKRFVETFATYTRAVVRQAADRENRHIRTVDEYLEVRRDTIGAKPSFALLEFDMDLPDEVHEHSVLKELTILCIDMILLGNDIASYNLEQSRGDDNHNMITVVMHHYQTDVQGAMSWVQQYHAGLETRFMCLYENELPTFGEPVDAQFARYVDGLGNWVRASDQWGFESQRYFGRMGTEIFKRRWVTLLPREKGEDVGPKIIDGTLL
ncbi:terpenoid synthase [Vararia minispora EC-137]|uniref:Terpenoid synthase n=1 Tax=Vararia minispora EC-137 TaxID=1314806 RepID=A0ACB8QZ05_9AGAM|nr:terpenoid synthase [Vararia minispora EC-137]